MLTRTGISVPGVALLRYLFVLVILARFAIVATYRVLHLRALAAIRRTVAPFTPFVNWENIRVSVLPLCNL